MSNVGYDLDTSGGLMPLIKALIKPPDEDLNTQKPKKPQHPYYKRPGKGHNHDSCDACGEGGDLICCDRCPASFHLGCYDPPLDENDIPAGLWLCRECRAYDDNKPASSRSSRAQSPADSKSDSEKKSRLLTRNNRANSKKRSKDEEDEIKQEPEPEKEKETEDKELSPMEVLVNAAKIMNPRQFELPREMRIPCVFPGTEKEGTKNGNASLITVDAWGCVPLPAKSCYTCQGTCKQAPLLQCDYCPLLFHQDCLDPPLTALPTGRWMCPNHVEQYIDWKLVNSISATERVALWDKFSGPVDQHAIKIDFIRRARKDRPAFRIKVPVSGPGRVVVPDMVRHHYRNPPPLMPSRREYVRCKNVLRNLKANGVYDEEEEGPKYTICMNMQCPEYSGEGECPAKDEPMETPTSPKVESESESSSDMSDVDYEYHTPSVKRRKILDDKSSKKGRSSRLELRPDGEVEELLAVVDEQLKKLDERLVKLLAWQRLQQVAWGEQAGGRWRRLRLSRAAAAGVRRGVSRARLARHGFRHVALPSQLLSRADRDRIAAAVLGAPPRHRARDDEPAQIRDKMADACVRAALCAVRPAKNGLGDGLGRPIPMRLSSLWVGSDSGCDVRLDASHCRRVSRNHAVIFVDEVSGHFELINYSEWGTRVNGVMYTCDATLCASHEPGDHDETRTAALRDLLRRREPPQQNKLNAVWTGAPECMCAGTWTTAGAWEGSALVPHGALLQFGCLMYVFCITDHLALPSDDESPSSSL
ncbi:PHD finger protein 12 [Manduca sexta]|uniref:PHD finger protein 12 n=1 Tax=Manduca sexta TaxID=7130 RepID=UPI00188E417E|nr:PHD finger protein 12 [Manduca sexta]